MCNCQCHKNFTIGPEEYADLMGCTIGAAYHAVAKHIPKSIVVKVGARIRLLRAPLMEWIANGGTAQWSDTPERHLKAVPSRRAVNAL